MYAVFNPINMNSVPPKTRDVFRGPVNSQLGRGKACKSCKSLKIRCDGLRPTCGPCSQRTKSCEYQAPAPAVAVEEKATVIQSATDVAKPVEPAANGSVAVPELSAANTELTTEEPSPEAQQELLDHFLPHASQFGFFLHPRRFRESALLPYPLGHPARPSPALLMCMYLWGLHVTHSRDLLVSRDYEPVFLQRALNELAHESASKACWKADQYRVTHAIQAEILLAKYFVRNNQYLESQMHANAAVSLAISFDLHKIRSARPTTPTLLGLVDGKEVYPSLSRNALEEGERINGFWTAFALERNLTIVLKQTAKGLGTLENPNIDIDTPWPVDIEAYDEPAVIPPAIRGSSTIQKFLEFGDVGNSNQLISQIGMNVKGVVIFHHASLLCLSWRPDMPSLENHNLILTCRSLLDRVHASLLPYIPNPIDWDTSTIEATPALSTSERTLVLTHAYIASTFLRIHTLFSQCGVEASRPLCVQAAQKILNLLSMGLPDFHRQSSVTGTLVMGACQTLGDAIKAAAGWSDKAAAAEHIAALRECLVGGIAMMAVLAVECPIMKYHLGKTQDLLRSLPM